MLVENKDRTALDHASFPLYQPPSDPGDHPPPCGLEDEKGIVSGLYVPSERGVQRGWGRVGGYGLGSRGGDGTAARGVTVRVRVDDDFFRHGGGAHPRECRCSSCQVDPLGEREKKELWSWSLCIRSKGKPCRSIKSRRVRTYKYSLLCLLMVYRPLSVRP